MSRPAGRPGPDEQRGADLPASTSSSTSMTSASMTAASMTTTTVLVAAVRSEWTKLRTLRPWLLTALLTVVASVALGVLAARGLAEQAASAGLSAGPGGAGTTTAGVTGAGAGVTAGATAGATRAELVAQLRVVGAQVVFLAQIGPVVLGALAAGSEFQAGQLRGSLLAVPRRGVFALAKAAATGLAGVLVGAMMAVAALAGGWVGGAGAGAGAGGSDLAAGGASVGRSTGGGSSAGRAAGAGAPMFDGSLVPWVVGVAGYAAAISLCAMGLALLTRSVLVSAGVWLALAFGLSRAFAMLPDGWGQWARFLPDRAGTALSAPGPSPGLLDPGAAAWTLAAWAVVAVVAGWWAVRRRDVG